jgi:hypothetical protein
LAAPLCRWAAIFAAILKSLGPEADILQRLHKQIAKGIGITTVQTAAWNAFGTTATRLLFPIHETSSSIAR